MLLFLYSKEVLQTSKNIKNIVKQIFGFCIIEKHKKRHKIKSKKEIKAENP